MSAIETLRRIRADLGKGPLTNIEEAAASAGVPYWTLLKAARGRNPNPRYKLLAAMAAYYAKLDAKTTRARKRAVR